MTTLTLHACKQWLKTSESPLARHIFLTFKQLRSLELPAPKYIFSPLYAVYIGVKNMIETFLRIFIWSPLFKSRLQACGRRLYLYGGIPYMAGPLSIHIDDDCRISGQTTITGRGSSAATPQLQIGKNVDLGWQSTLAVGSRIMLGNNVRIAGQCFLAGYPGHPINTIDRANGLPETDDQVGDIQLSDDVWLATGVMVMAGVTIGQGTIVAAGSIVTKDLPPMVLAAGCPAVAVRSLLENENRSHNLMDCQSGRQHHAK